MTTPDPADARMTPLLVLLSTVFGATLVIGVALGSKLIGVFGVIASASAFTYPITFFLTDVIAEIWGKDVAKRVVFNGFVALVLMFVVIQLVLLVPGAEIWGNEEGFNTAFGLSTRLIAAGTIAYLVSQLHDVWAFHFWKRVTSGRHLWLRNNASTVVSQCIDTAIFVTLGFAGVAPLWELFLGQFLLKAALAVADTPFIYAGVLLIRRRYQLPPLDPRDSAATQS